MAAKKPEPAQPAKKPEFEEDKPAPDADDLEEDNDDDFGDGE